LELSAERTRISGSTDALCDAIRRGADLRVYTEFLHNEHIDPTSDSDELVQEVSDFRVTFLLNDSWSAGIMNLRQPIELPAGFGPRPSMSFFLYNQDGQQAIARPHLDGLDPAKARRDAPKVDDHTPLAKMHHHGAFDMDTNSPSANFIYDFETYRFSVCNCWKELFSHDVDGQVRSGSLDDLTDAFAEGCEVKVGVRGLCDPLGEDSRKVDHEVFVHAGPAYYYTQSRQFMVGTQPVVRVRPSIPMLYASRGWDFGWLMLRTDGHAVYRRCDPYTLAFTDIESRHAIRWFVRE
jgi:hypothetical protein